MWLIQNGNLTQIVVNPASTALTASSGRQIPWKPKLIPLLGFYTLSSEYILQTNETCWAFSIKYQKTLMARGPFHSLHSHSASFQLETNAACFLVFLHLFVHILFETNAAGFLLFLLPFVHIFFRFFKPESRIYLSVDEAGETVSRDLPLYQSVPEINACCRFRYSCRAVQREDPKKKHFLGYCY